MLPRSIATRVVTMFASVILLAAALLCSGLVVATQVRDGNARVADLSRLLRSEDVQDRAQQRLRLDIGDVTRLAEREGAAPDATWNRLDRELAAFRALSAWAAPDVALPGAGRALAARRAAAARFADDAAHLLAGARRDPATIKAGMRPFLDSLRTLEGARADTRLVLIRGIDDATRRNRDWMFRSMVDVLVGGVGVMLILLAAVVWLRLRVIRPIVGIADRLRELNEGRAAPGDLPGIARRDEVGELARGLSEYRDAVERRRVAERRAEFLAHHDMLTGLPNRLLFEDRLAHELRRARRSGHGVAVFAIDLDDFKLINDRLGHAGGDQALRQAARVLEASVRADDLVARLGGDEFAILQVAPDQPRAAEALVARLFHAAGDEQGRSAVRMSVGVALSAPEQEADELYNHADMAMYRAKSSGGNTAAFFDARFKEEVRLRWRLTRDLEGAGERGELHLAFQPIARADTLAVTGYEALLRWTHPELGPIAPDTFIPLAESSGRIDAIGLWAADRAMAAAAGWPRHLSLALNLSPIQFREPSLADALLSLAESNGLDARRLVFEVTESATLLGKRRDAVLDTLRALQRGGARIAMDDFGTGHSSLGNLRDFRFDKLKIDRSFIGSLDNPASASIVRSIIALSESLDIPVVAEGVETEAQLAFLRRWSCRQVQGYLIGRPAADPFRAAADQPVEAAA